MNPELKALIASQTLEIDEDIIEFEFEEEPQPYDIFEMLSEGSDFSADLDWEREIPSNLGHLQGTPDSRGLAKYLELLVIPRASIGANENWLILGT